MRLKFMLCLLVGGLSWSAQASELLMFTLAGCPYCAAFERDVGGIYPKTAEHVRAPLRRIDWSSRGRWAVRAVEFAPTFVLVGDDGREVGRIEGYRDDLSFWSQLSVLLRRLPEDGQATAL